MSSSLTVPTDVTAPDIRNASDASVVPDENSVTAINMRNRAILYESNHPNHSFEPSVLNLVNNMPNDEASESRFFTRASERTAITTALLDGAADALEASTSQPLSQSPENPSEQKETTDAKPKPPPFFRCCQCQHTSRSPNCQRKDEEIGIIQGKEQRVLVVNAECVHVQCMRCVNVDENGVRIGVKPWELEWRGPAISRRV
ncbi:hypothetical protein OCU04_011823 [Sclerotinia nivalis]|uniref:Uncharacterized protein n=1 Tax=Sclerotinia nivalis TaxID=352851 RepID=A0A9X0A9P5_9HELO|nr:hypothetical protein OCU04_011823 [Sclerotinia nivalis]